MPTLALVTVLAAGCSEDAPRMQAIAGDAQGTTYTIQWWTTAQPPDAQFSAAVQEELERLDALLSNYREDSVIERFNAARTNGPYALPTELVALLRIAGQVHAASAGCFDPTVRPLVTLWGLDRGAPRVPDGAEISAALARVGLDKLEIVSPNAVRKAVPDLELDLSSIGQGYTVAQLSELAAQFGLEHYLIELGGEIAARGHKPDGTPWRVGVEDPLRVDDPVRRRLTLPTDRPAAVITSGTYRNFFDAEGTRYSHILDPRTGRPVTHDLVSVTVLSADATSAAAWATALLCLGAEAAGATAARENVAALMYVRDGESRTTERTTPALSADWSAALE